MLKPQSISQIHQQICAKWFRVRNVITLRDYLILEFTQVGFIMGDPRWAEVVCLDDQMFSTIDCTERKYVLLSTKDELTMYRRHKKGAVSEILLASYKASREPDIGLGPIYDIGPPSE